MRRENRNGEGECYQVNAGTRAVYRESEARLVSLDIAGEPVQDERIYTMGLQGYHVNNCQAYLNSHEELSAQRRGSSAPTDATCSWNICAAPEPAARGVRAAGLRGLTLRRRASAT